MTQDETRNTRLRERRTAVPIRSAPHLKPVSAAVLLVLGAGLAQAQTTAGVTDTVVVTGLRHSIETSIAAKRNSDQIVEALSAEDIGKLPETSIAESLARLPGLTAQRVNGRDTVISIRGLSPKFAVTLLNGREMVSTGDNRQVEFDQFPGELINSGTVYKTPDVALGAQGLSGTVNLGTISPLSVAGRQLNIGLRGEKNSNGSVVPGTKASGNRLSLSYVDQFADRTIGVALGFAHLDSPNQEKYFNSWWWGNSAIWWGGFRGLENVDPNKAPATLQGFDAGVRSIDNKRDGFLAVLEYKPNKDFRSQVDLYYSKFGQKSQGREFQANLMPDWSGNGTVDGPVTGGPIYSNVHTSQVNGFPVVTSGTIGNVDPFVLMRYSKRDDKVTALGWNNELKFAGWKAVADLSYSKAKRDEQVGEAYASATTLTGFSSFNANTGSGFSQYTPSLNYGGGLQLRGISEWDNLNGVGASAVLSPIVVNDEMKALKLSGRRSLDLGPLSSFEGGVNYTDRSKDTNRSQTVFALKSGSSCIGGKDICAPIPAGLLQAPVDLGFVGVPNLVGFDMMSAVNAGLYNSGATNVAKMPGRIWGVGEKVATAYAKLGLDFDVGVPVRGDLGLQVVHTDQSSTGVAWDPTANKATNMEFGKTYNDVLPALNLAAEVGGSTKLRLGVAKSLARPAVEDMRAGFSASPATSGANLGRWSGGGGNPYLEPWRATALDFSVEHYLGKRSLIAGALFHKKLKSSIYVDNTLFDFTGFPNTTGVTPVCMVGQTNCNIGTLSAPINGSGGYIQGWELSATLDFGTWVKPLEGLGMVATMSHNHSNLPGHANDGKMDLTRTIEGLSGNVNSLTVYYERNGFSARWAQRYRSKYVAEVRGVWIDNSLAAIESERTSDAQIGYAFETGPLKGFSILFQVNNITNTPYRTTLNDDSYTSIVGGRLMMPERYNEYGRRYLLGVNYKL